jgi:hypothetical protein
VTEGIVPSEENHNLKTAFLLAIPSDFASLSHLPLLRGGFYGHLTIFYKIRNTVRKKERKYNAV